ncbi:ABC transporter substrate-binding protein [Latilactobacillus curvatus]|uniref:Sugar ABC transporter substrate-binding protein n=1 Tax=Latilactobacillus curvatus TaxID=28038 RepID=A0AAC9XZX9_LATCU|nr:ABC transporter substrate-binding protein [Latilactobacillus curvatus]ASN59205.1 sugar ABC transporter substrate-binding protein [Latilactobacillus curvatus]MDT3394480.1 ABC transporter substrate-binding protein [Bacillota bacterium]QAR34643.1 extracellular solute-binding protein [Latilactobacillus curvatus]
MKKWVRNLTMVGMVALSATVLAACGKSDKSASDDGKTTVSMYMPGDKPKNYTAIINKANKEIHKTYKDINLKMTFIGWGDYEQKYNVMVTSGDDYDLAFAQNYPSNAAKGAYADLTDLLKKDAKKAYNSVDPAYWKGLTVNNKIYGFPVNANIYAQNVLTFNQSFLDKYNINIDDVNSYESMEPALEQLHKEKPGVAAFAIGQGYKASPAHMDFPLGNGLPFAIDSTGKDKKVVNVYDTAEMKGILNTLHGFYKKGYIPQDAATSSTQYNLQDNTWFVRQETQGPYDYGDTALINNAGGKKMVSKPITEPFKSSAQSQVAVWAVSKTSKHKEAAVKVLNLLNTDKTLLNNIAWGLEGQQWNFTDKAKGKIKLTDKYKPNYFIGAWMMGNNNNLYTQDSVTDAMIDKRKADIKDAKQSVALGFNPDTTKVKTEVTNLSNVMSKYLDILNTGTADPEPTIAKMDKELKTAGYDKVQKELQSQYDAFLAKQ